MINKATPICMALLFLSFNSLAHEQEKHNAPSSQSSCDAMLDRNHTDMDMDDPVALAMLKKCQSLPKENADKKPGLDPHQENKAEAKQH
ncbi:MAG TPA: hypothetical protein ENI26_03880 [Methylophaga aminisulfidivorans]|nr:hypothetical protein [Methylophaga thiooxydans]HDZ16453.1 hypothetical protein [Methylophaga aminisulfidivorans]HEC73496.1 hypothetical protein [Methylophaga aminisulfidivorans]